MNKLRSSCMALLIAAMSLVTLNACASPSIDAGLVAVSTAAAPLDHVVLGTEVHIAGAATELGERMQSSSTDTTAMIFDTIGHDAGASQAAPEGLGSIRQCRS